MSSNTRTRPIAVRILIALLVLLGVGAVPSGFLLVIAPDGHLMQMPLSMLEHSPFSDFLIPGLILLILLGIYPLVVAYSLWKRPRWRWPDAINPFRATHWSWAAALAAGAILIIWIIVEMIMLRTVVFLHALCLGWGVAIVLLTVLPSVRRYCARGRTP